MIGGKRREQNPLITALVDASLAGSVAAIASIYTSVVETQQFPTLLGLFISLLIFLTFFLSSLQRSRTRNNL